MKKATVNKTISFEIDNKTNVISPDGKPVLLDIKGDKGKFHVITDMRSFNVEIIETEANSKQFLVAVNGNAYHVQLKDQYDLLLDQMGLNDSTSNSISDLRAPMPGMVLEILVQPGDIVSKGDNLLVLEAMKMENLIKSPIDAIIREIVVVKSQKIEKGQLIFIF
ncbi:acetyl-CoA carboxylase biotin carboxyl carrier protein subunit [Pedobacter sp. HMF7647]|uniref:Acetyl-CoA carboxylase biotin carboxyl carrier protein subunit n=1 Tax=Hufsiella arboris TaxID=2695275 RepID=A0A7K1YC79_9SPHI|nr:acetyl-CoA carboxylase biotin carboxyl carrier protein subunit [Hufsiella arboris]MXV51648.1 acetyl-CoA carboxylase biotin carboxyl carrier protein subunit [Hufsiella arboris]